VTTTSAACRPAPTFVSESFDPSKAVDRVARGVATLSLNQVVVLASRFLVVPIAMFAWGKVLYGEWILLSGLVSFLSLADLGMQTFVVNRLTVSYARNGREMFNRDLQSALRVQITLAFALLSIIVLLVKWAPLQSLFGLSELGHVQFSITIVLLASELLLCVPMGVIGGAYRATGHLARGAAMGVSKEMALMLATIAIILSSKNLAYIVAARVGIAVCISLLMIFDLRHLHSWVRFWRGIGSYREGLAMVTPGLFFLLMPVANYIESQSTLVVVQRFLSSGEVSRLATHSTAVNLGRVVSGLLTASLWPEITALYAVCDLQKLRAWRRMLVRSHLWLVGGCAFAVLFLLPAIYPLWTARRLSIDLLTLAFLSLRLALWAFWYPNAIVLLAINKHRLIACSAFASALIAAVFALVLVPRMGISGAALATLLADSATSAWLAPYLASRELGEAATSSLVTTFVWPLSALAPAVAIMLLSWAMSTNPVFRYGLFLPAAAITGVLFVKRQLTFQERSLIQRVVLDLAAAQRSRLR